MYILSFSNPASEPGAANRTRRACDGATILLLVSDLPAGFTGIAQS